MQRYRTGVAATALLAIGAVLAGATAATAAAPVAGSVAGPVVTIKGKTFTVTTTLSPTGKSKVTVTSKTTITAQAAGTRADVKKGACVVATGTKKGTAVAATRVSLMPKSGGRCGGRPGGGGGGGTGRPGGGTPPAGGGGGFTPPANLGFAAGAVSAIKGSTVTVKGQRGTTTVTLSAKTAVSKTVSVGASAIKAKLCAFVAGTSADKGVTISAQNVSLSKPTSTGCTPRRRGA